MKTIRNQCCSALYCLGLFLTLIPAGSPAASLSLSPSADAFVTSGPSGNLSGNNYGGAGALGVAAAGSAKGEFQSLLQFDLSGAKSSFDAQFGIGQWSLQSVTLQLTAAAPNNAIFNASTAGQFGVSWMQNNGWLEGSGTPAAPGTSGITLSTLSSFLSPGDETLGTFAFSGATSGSITLTLGLAPSFTADVLAGNTVSLRMLAADNAISGLFDSRSFTTASARPSLTISAVPEPGTLVLGAAGLCMLVRRRLFRRPQA